MSTNKTLRELSLDRLVEAEVVDVTFTVDLSVTEKLRRFMESFLSPTFKKDMSVLTNDMLALIVVDFILKSCGGLSTPQRNVVVWSKLKETGTATVRLTMNHYLRFKKSLLTLDESNEFLPDLFTATIVAAYTTKTTEDATIYYEPLDDDFLSKFKFTQHA